MRLNLLNNKRTWQVADWYGCELHHSERRTRRTATVPRWKKVRVRTPKLTLLTEDSIPVKMSNCQLGHSNIRITERLDWLIEQPHSDVIAEAFRFWVSQRPATKPTAWQSQVVCCLSSTNQAKFFFSLVMPTKAEKQPASTQQRSSHSSYKLETLLTACALQTVYPSPSPISSIHTNSLKNRLKNLCGPYFGARACSSVV